MTTTTERRSAFGCGGNDDDDDVADGKWYMICGDGCGSDACAPGNACRVLLSCCPDGITAKPLCGVSAAAVRCSPSLSFGDSPAAEDSLCVCVRRGVVVHNNESSVLCAVNRAILSNMPRACVCECVGFWRVDGCFACRGSGDFRYDVTQHTHARASAATLAALCIAQIYCVVCSCSLRHRTNSHARARSSRVLTKLLETLTCARTQSKHTHTEKKPHKTSK